LELVYITPTVLVVVEIQSLYSESGLEYQKYHELHVYQPQLSKISGLSFYNFSHSISIYNYID